MKKHGGATWVPMDLHKAIHGAGRLPNTMNGGTHATWTLYGAIHGHVLCGTVFSGV